MKEVFEARLDEIQPSQLYVSEAKLNVLLKRIRTGQVSKIEPIPIKILDGEMVATDGHTRGVAWLICGYEKAKAEWEDSELDWEAYRICVQWCKGEGIHSLGDLRERIVNHYDYEKLWLDKCRVMQDDLRMQRESL